MANRGQQALNSWQRPFQRLLQVGPVHTLVVCVLVSLVLAAIDLITPPQLDLTFAYALIVLLATWNMGVSAGIVFAAVASGMQYRVLSEFWVGSSGSLFWYILLLNRVFTFGVTVALTGALRRMFDIVQERSLRDALTNAVNASHFLVLLNAEIARSARSSLPFTLAYLDCDNFKSVNTEHGHLKGDAVLRAVVDTARKSVRGIDTVARLGGDEFAIIFPETDKPNAMRVLDRLQSNLRTAMRELGVQTSVSIGALTVRAPAATANDVLTAGDELMFKAKRLGKDRVVHETLGAAEPQEARTGS